MTCLCDFLEFISFSVSPLFLFTSFYVFLLLNLNHKHFITHTLETHFNSIRHSDSINKFLMKKKFETLKMLHFKFKIAMKKVS